jgi:hypothetical protein
MKKSRSVTSPTPNRKTARRKKTAPTIVVVKVPAPPPPADRNFDRWVRILPAIGALLASLWRLFGRRD